jgi:cold shock CspA family protein
MTGQVKKLVADKNFGFIVAEDHREYFFHRQSFRGDWDELTNDMNDSNPKIFVEFEESEGPKGPRAENVERLDKPDEEKGRSKTSQRARR